MIYQPPELLSLVQTSDVNYPIIFRSISFAIIFSLNSKI